MTEDNNEVFDSLTDQEIESIYCDIVDNGSLFLASKCSSYSYSAGGLKCCISPYYACG